MTLVVADLSAVWSLSCSDSGKGIGKAAQGAYRQSHGHLTPTDEQTAGDVGASWLEGVSHTVDSVLDGVVWGSIST